MPSPPKPWEIKNNGTTASLVSAPITSQQQPMTDTVTASTIPTVPTRPSAMGTGMSSTGGINSSYGGYGGTTGYGGTFGSGGYGSGGYGSGGYGSGGYGSYGSGYGSGYNSYGSGYGSYNRYGSVYGSSYGSYGGLNSYSPYNQAAGFGPNGGGMFGGEEQLGLTQRMETSTRATFDVIQSIVGAFGGFAQMLDSTYMATHSSFMAMVGVAEQFGHLRHYLAGIFSIFALVRWAKRMLYRISGRQVPLELLPSSESQQEDAPATDNEEILQITANADESTTDSNSQPQSNSTTQTHSRISRKRPIIIFLALVTGLPYFMYKLIQRYRLVQQQQRMMIPQQGSAPEVAHVIHDFIAENPIELTIHRGDVVQVLSKVDPATGAPCEWWQGRLSNGVIGIFPANYVQIR